MTFLNKYLLFCFLLNSIYVFSQRTEISGYVREAKNGNPIVYATILDMQEKGKGTTSNSNGYFSFETNPEDVSLFVSAIGYHDTIVMINDSQTSINISLRPKDYFLDEVVVKGEKLEKYKIGSESYPIRQKANKYIGFPFKSAGFSHGLYIGVNNKTKNSLLKSISYFVADKGPLGGEFLIRFLVPTDRLKSNFMKDLNEFSDLSSIPIIIKAEKRGWNTLDCLEYNIRFPEKDFVMLFIPLDNGENLNWKDEDGYWYSSVFAVYERKSIQNLNWIIKKFSKVAYIKRSDNYVPAFVFDVLK